MMLAEVGVSYSVSETPVINVVPMEHVGWRFDAQQPFIPFCLSPFLT